MSAGWGAIAQGATAMLGQVAQGVGQSIANRENAKASRSQRRWAEYMASTAYQRTVKDMRAAGLNPLLAMGLGATGNQGYERPTYQNPAEGSGSSARQVGIAMAQLRNIQSDTRLKEKMTEVQDFLGHKLIGEAQLAWDSAKRAAEEAKGVQIENRLREWRMPAAKAQAEVDSSVGGEYLRWLNRVMRSARGERD